MPQSNPRARLQIWGLLALSAVSLSAQAHTPYLLPNIFHASNRKPVISVDASRTDNMFIPDLAWAADTRFSVTTPGGAVIAIPASDVHQLATRTVIEHPLAVAEGADPAGTYRLMAGPTVGAASRSWEINGKVERVRDPGVPMPAGAKLQRHTQTISSAAAYITVDAARVAEGQPARPAPAAQALQATGKGLEIVPVSHPNQLYAGGRFDFRVQFDGKLLPDHKVDVVYSNMDFSGKSTRLSVNTDRQGAVSYPLAQPGVYMATVRFSDDAPLSATTPTRTYSHALTFKAVMPQAQSPADSH